MPCALGSLWKVKDGHPDHPEPIAPFPPFWSELLISEQQIYDSLCYVQYFCKIYSEDIWEKGWNGAWNLFVWFV